jgi:hypothetical protein
MSKWLTNHHKKIIPGAFGLVFLLMILAGVFVTFQLSTLVNRTNQQGKVIDSLSAGLDTSRKQLSNHGIEPSAPPASQIIQGVQGAQGNEGPQGTPGIPGPVGPSGSPGPVGPSGKNGVSGSQGTPGVTVTGAPGSTGPMGATGPVGPAGPIGPVGPAGKDGTDGKDGKDGSNGSSPAGWTYSWTDSSGTKHDVTCTRTADSDPSSPQYTCTDSPSAPATSPSSMKKAVTPSSSVSAQRDNGNGSGGEWPLMASLFYAWLPERKYV